MPRVLFVAGHRPGRAPGQRFRFEQYLDHLRAAGFEHEFSYLLSAADDHVFYRTGNLPRKSWIVLKAASRRLRDVARASRFDIVFIQREALMAGSPVFERLFARSGARLVFDFDDSIWHADVSNANKRFGWLKNPGKTATIISMADLVIAGNQYLAEYARQHQSNVIVIPTTIDTGEYIRASVPRTSSVCIGWSGSLTTIKHFEYAVPFLRRLKSKYGDAIHIKVIGDSHYRNDELGIHGLAWDKETEIRELSTFDIGIMPLPDDEWANGKCGLKGLQYMALEVATVMSPVGVNTEIITDGMNGFLACSSNEWVAKISALIESPDLRERIGKAARHTVETRYSVHANKAKYIDAFNSVLSGESVAFTNVPGSRSPKLGSSLFRKT